ncbi:MAG: DUF3368 domain-containing protein [Methanoregula sp.]|jgi:hypothetical protein
MSNAVSDSSPLIHLAAIGRLSLIRDYYDSIIIPTAVWREVVEQGEGRKGAMEIKNVRADGWITVVSPKNAALIKALLQDLHEGEAESIALAIELTAGIIILDETEARHCAEQHGLPVSGIIGILLQAKADGKIKSMRAELERLHKTGNFWISKSLHQMLLTTAGENRK